MNLASAILQMAIAILSSLNSTPNLQQWQRDQAAVIANQAIQFANQTLAQGGYTNNCPSGNYYNCNGYNPGTTTGVSLLVLGSENTDTAYVRSGSSYNVVWSPFDTSRGFATLELYNTQTGSVYSIGNAPGNSLTWIVNAAPGSYQLRVTQQGSQLMYRGITVQ